MSKKENYIKDDSLKNALKKIEHEDAVSSNFNFKVMQEIEKSSIKPKYSRLMPIWASIVIAGGFGLAIILAFIYGEIPENSSSNLEFQAPKKEFLNYFILGIIAIAAYFSDTLFKFIKGRF